jgi:cell wall assembly regulator SMI1
MDLLHKLQQIISIQNKNSEEKNGELNDPIKEQQIARIEKLLGETLNEECIKLYSYADGQMEGGKGVLFGERFISSEEVIHHLEFSHTLVKPENKRIENKEKSDELIKKIVDFYRSKAPTYKFPGFKKRWYKMEFKCGVGAYEGPYLYPDESTTEEKRKLVDIDFASYETIAASIQALHESEKETYNWDNLEFVVFANGDYEVERTFYDFDNQIPFSSLPEHAIRKKYFHNKWLPLFSDYGGNYIGIDYDPDINGKKGQVINFGRDEEEMIVLADSLENFFDFILSELQKADSKLLSPAYHLHDLLKDMKK